VQIKNTKKAKLSAGKNELDATFCSKLQVYSIA